MIKKEAIDMAEKRKNEMGNMEIVNDADLAIEEAREADTKEAAVLDPSGMNTTVLAYLGDSVWEICIRDRLISSGMMHVDKLHKEAVKFVSAEGQAFAIKTMISQGFLTANEDGIVKRARNHKLVASKKNSKKDQMTDKYATAFEALLGYLYLGEDPERLEKVLDAAFILIDRAVEE